MQKDMHYYGTYCLARCGGFDKQEAHTIANCAEFVDEAVDDKDVFFEDGRAILPEMTAHKMIDEKNADPDDQRKVWLPFHFLPGAEGNTIDEKMICRKDSEIAQKVIENHFAHAKKVPYDLHLMGVLAHVYADTFAHYGFVGANREINGIDASTIQLEVDNDNIFEYITSKGKRLLNKVISATLTGVFPLGHGAAATYPDRPYLKWSYERETDGKKIIRNNHDDFMEGAEKIHRMFQNYTSKGVPWSDIKDVVSEILALEAEQDGRIEEWKKQLRAGKLTGQAEDIPDFDGHTWLKQVRTAKQNQPPHGEILQWDVHLFYRAARYHRNYVLTDLLPEYELLIS